MIKLSLKLPAIGALAFAFAGVALPQQASATVIELSETMKFLLIGTGPSSTAIAAATSNYELGAIQAPVPSPSSYGPGLAGNVPALPAGIQAVPTGVLNNGEIAITHATGQFDLANVGLYATTGVQCAGSASNCAKGASNSAFNQPGYPNNSAGTFTPFNPAFQLGAATTSPVGTGVVGNVNFTALKTEIANAATTIASLAATQTINFVSGKLSSDLTTVLAHGLNVIDLVSSSGSGDLLVEKVNWVIDGFADSVAIFRVPDYSKFLIQNGNILAGSGLGGLDRLLFFSDRLDNAQHFAFDNSIINGVAFWTMNGEIVLNDVEGCTQLLSPKINLNDVRLSRCAFGGDVPVPLNPSLTLTATALFATGLFIGWRKRRQKLA
jgi:hypothetical protein